MDASAMVDVALNWPGVSSQRECLSPMMRPNISIPFRLVFITQFSKEMFVPMMKPNINIHFMLEIICTLFQ